MADVDLGPESIARVRDAADILDVVGDHVRLKKRGRSWEGLCPFHEEKTPSFSVNPEKGVYYCFGCQKGGDLFSFLMEIEHLNFPEAVERLARRFGVKLPPRSPEMRRRREAGEQLRGLLQEAQQFFVDRLEDAEGSIARSELERRGFPRETWREFGFGFAPDDWRRLLDHMKRRHPEGKLVDSGLAVRPDSGTSPYDRFRSRLTFPIHSGDGSLIAFGGRQLGEGEPKYLNSPESSIFRKRSTLFCLDRARRSLADSGKVLIVEGYFDCLSLHRVGVKNSVATLGTALTSDHARLLKRRLGPEGLALLCYDADTAGRRAAATGAGVLLEAGVEVAVVMLPPGMDPDDLVRERGGEAMKELIERPTPLLEFLLADLPPDPAARRRSGLDLAMLVCSASNPAIRQNLIDELARQLYLRPQTIEEHGSRGRRVAPIASVQKRESMPPGERELARMLLECSSGWRSRILEFVLPEYITDSRVRRLLEDSRTIVKDETSKTDFVSVLLERCSDPGLKTLVAELCTSPMPEITDESIRVQMQTLLLHQAREGSRRLEPLISAAEKRGDREEVDRLLAEKQRLRLELTEI
ncbi:MAG: DNA primase [Acidobacteriota bacterium]|jgi:DNA primase